MLFLANYLMTGIKCRIGPTEALFLFKKKSRLQHDNNIYKAGILTTDHTSEYFFPRNHCDGALAKHYFFFCVIANLPCIGHYQRLNHEVEACENVIFISSTYVDC